MYAELDDLEALIAAAEADQDPQNQVAQEEAKEAKEKAKGQRKNLVSLKKNHRHLSK